MKINSIVLSAGKGTRMKSEKPKVIQPVLGYEMVNHVLKALTEAGVEDNLLVVGYKKDEVLNSIDSRFSFDYAEQTEQLGTGHAVLVTKDKLASKEGITIVTSGDTPLVTSETFKSLVTFMQENDSDLAVLTTTYDDPTGYGRIVRNDDQSLARIVEQKDADSETLKINEVNTGVYAFDNQKLFKYIELITNDNAQNEYYLTDLIELFKDGNENVHAFCIEDNEQVVGVNDLVALERVNSILRTRINREHMLNGVQIINSDSTFIGPNVEIGQGTIVYPGNVLLGDCKIGDKVILNPNNTIDNSNVGNDTTVGPMAYLRGNANVGDNCRVGNFVEFKNTTFGNGSKSAHLTYIGDAEVGENVNIGCGVITANYDGVNKHKTTIGDNSFIGSNANLVAPVELGTNVFVAAGTTVTKDVENEKFVIDRQELRIKNRK
ncbi:bifunctional UDP-N-acetylglucosamine diphosphorylase/glucosamine-1-phosphate N-acetyltransferase GlmU [Mollicutes bacterium LVI A0078]|nr:bifunctional UDP-N-acetylglucosamine diphosphorylase/glucosamine-1-phosphate N-acetyltransferase GlmU [Mollicutes bacterium LVI A0075]WOO91255.1 bifunctional UDP-N-acetylglucosamine diphosphorylase/glucosamine-1-phosphate N-acetyltransferase GlmU [Mollicutes bacterium LVI A0078]